MRRTAATITLFLVALTLLAAAKLLAQEEPVSQAVPGKPSLMRLEGVDVESGIHYVRLTLSLPALAGSTQAPPRLTMECTDNKGKKDLAWLMTFGGVESTKFVSPFRPTQTDPFAPSYPSARLKMTFEGYTKWKPVTRVWEVLPTGELRYRNPGMQSPNMDTPRSFLPYLNSLPGLRIGYAKPGTGDPPDTFFPTQPLLDELKKTRLCEP